MKRKLLLMMASLLLAGAVSAQTNFWENNPDSHAQPSNTPIVASVQIDGTAITATDAMRLGAFVGNDLRGIAAPHTDGKFWIQVFYTDQTDNISFKFYNGTTEYTTCETTLNGSDEGYGTPNEPVVLNFTTTQTMEQNQTMAAGWTWWSTPIEFPNNTALQTLESALGTSGVRIQSMSNGYVDRIEYGGNSVWFGTLQSIVNEQMYMVKANASCDISLSGPIAVASQHPITINPGMNWIGFTSSQNLSVSTALSGFAAEANDQIKSSGSGFSTYVVYGSNAMWFGTLNTLEVGQGYMYMSNSSESKSLVYQTGRNESLEPNITSKGNFFEPEHGEYAFNMTITAVVELDGVELCSEDYELVAFAGDQCRGSVKLMYVEPINRYIAFLLVSGDREEPLRFALTDGKDLSWSTDCLGYKIDGISGTPTEPVVLHFGPLGVNDNNITTVNVYPNPSRDVFNVESNGMRKYEIVNAFGQVVLSKEIKEDNIQIDLGKMSSGMYLLRVVTDNGIATKQLIKE